MSHNDSHFLILLVLIMTISMCDTNCKITRMNDNLDEINKIMTEKK